MATIIYDSDRVGPIRNNILNAYLIRKIVCGALLSSAAFILASCDKAETQRSEAESKSIDNMDAQAQLQHSAELFSGCYTVSYDEPSQIKVSLQDNGLVMQMKEPKSAGRIWDAPEPLNVLPSDTASDYFSIDSEHITGLVGRPDNLFVLGYVEEAYVNIDPLLDSPYLGFILQGSNTIYKVECDDVPSGDPVSTSPHQSSDIDDESRISIEPAPRAEPQ